MGITFKTNNTTQKILKRKKYTSAIEVEYTSKTAMTV
jgi:hypothetical protein